MTQTEWHWAMALVTTTPVLRQIVTQENDVAAAALFLAALVYSARYGRHGRMANVVLAAMALGLLAGTKYYALGYAAVVGTGVLLLVVLCGPSDQAGRVVVIALVGLVLLGSYWYLRNFLVTGTPLFPKGFTEATDLWRQMRPGSPLSTLAGSGRPQVWPMLLAAVRAETGPSHLGGVVMLPTSLAWLVGSGLLMRRMPAPDRRLRCWLVLLVLLAGLMLVSTPNLVETRLGTMNMLKSRYHSVRFGLCFWSLAVLALAAVLDDLARWAAALARRAKPWASAGLRVLDRAMVHVAGGVAGLVPIGIYSTCAMVVVYQLVRHARHPFTGDLLLLAGDVFLGGALLLLCMTSRMRIERLVGGAIVAVGALAFVWGSGELSARWHREFSPYYTQRFGTELYRWLSGLDPARERICVCDYQYYPLFGSRRQFNVYRPLWLADRAALLDYVRRYGITLVVARSHEPFPEGSYAKVRGWIGELPEVFSVVHEEHQLSVVRVDRVRLASVAASLEGEARWP